ncbi:MAG: YceI family protein [Breznakibacter sp.]
MSTNAVFRSTRLMAILLVGTVLTANAQSRVTIDFANSSVVVKGTSTLHDWEMKATEYLVYAVTEEKGADAIVINEGAATFKSAKILSESSGMDKKAHEALKVSKFPEIVFKVTSPAQLGLANQKGQLKGDLTIAGVTKQVVVPVSILSQGTNKWVLNASMKFKMSDYGIVPPTALMGTVKSGDAIEMDFKLAFKK